MQRRPLIGITLDFEDGGGWSSQPWYAVRENYCRAVSDAGGLPVLEICGGQQLLQVVLGGTLIQHIPDEVPGALAHEQPRPRTQAGHSVKLVPGTLLRRICGCDEMAVNSAHHQAAKDCGPDAVVNAHAPDSVIEGIESPHYRFCLGVQWHPEYILSDADRSIFQAFAAAADA